MSPHKLALTKLIQQQNSTSGSSDVAIRRNQKAIALLMQCLWAKLND